jgi:hypothetical protein
VPRLAQRTEDLEPASGPDVAKAQMASFREWQQFRSVVLTIRSLYDNQQFKFAGPYGDNGFLEHYVAKVNGEPIGCVVLVTRNAAGQTQHVVASYRPRTSLLHFARLLGEKFAGTPIAEHFAASEPSSSPK